MTLREKCPYLDFFWSVFSQIRTEYGEILQISPYSVRMRETTDQKNFEHGHFSHSVKEQCQPYPFKRFSFIFNLMENVFSIGSTSKMVTVKRFRIRFYLSLLFYNQVLDDHLIGCKYAPRYY